MRARRATLAVAITTLLAGASSAHAAPADVRVRVEGVASTIFDGVVHTDGHDVRAASDTTAHHCDGTKPGHAAGPTATAATVDALATVTTQGFDGHWSSGLEDYFITRLGPEQEDANKLWSWGILVNRAFTPYGGCQVQVHTGDEVLWANDAFSNRPFLWLGGPATAQLDTPLTVAVSSTNGNAGAPAAAYAGAQVAAVTATGQPVPAGTADAATSAADGTAGVVFHTAGWQRLKARTSGAHPAAIASNSIDVCVEATAGAGCGGTPPSQQPLPPGGSPSTPPVLPHGRPPKAAAPAWTRRFARGTLRDDRARGLRWHGAWTKTAAAGAWHGTLTRGRAGARLALELGPGRPAFALKTAGARTRIEIRAGGRTQTFTLAATRVPRIRRLVGARRAHRGTVVLRVVSGTILLDGVGRAG